MFAQEGRTSRALLFNVLETKDFKPCQSGPRRGPEKRGPIHAKEIHLQPIGDQAAPMTPSSRATLIGDSISGNYDRGLRPSSRVSSTCITAHQLRTFGKGRSSIWSGWGRTVNGRHWGVISFNHGHWDSKNDKASYQENLEKIITELKKTQAKLIWVTTCPVPNGFPPAPT